MADLSLHWVTLLLLNEAATNQVLYILYMYNLTYAYSMYIKLINQQLHFCFWNKRLKCAQKQEILWLQKQTNKQTNKKTLQMLL